MSSSELARGFSVFHRNLQETPDVVGTELSIAESCKEIGSTAMTTPGLKPWGGLEDFIKCSRKDSEDHTEEKPVVVPHRY